MITVLRISGTFLVCFETLTVVATSDFQCIIRNNTSFCFSEHRVFKVFQDPIRVPRIREKHFHRVPRIRENRVPRITEIGSLHVHARYLKFSFEKNWQTFYAVV